MAVVSKNEDITDIESAESQGVYPFYQFCHSGGNEGFECFKDSCEGGEVGEGTLCTG
jgi:hypothetical protein